MIQLDWRQIANKYWAWGNRNVYSTAPEDFAQIKRLVNRQLKELQQKKLKSRKWVKGEK